MKKALVISAVSFALFVIPLAVFAQASQTSGLPPSQTSGTPPVTSTALINPLGITSICGLIKALLGAAIAIGIPIAVLFIVWAGLKFVLAMGKPEELVKARNNMLYTVIGIAIFLGAWLLASVIANTVNALQQGSGQASVISCT